MEADKIEAFKDSKALKAATTVISKKEWELNATLAALAAAQAQALEDIVASRTAAEFEMAIVRAEVEEAVAATRVEAKNTAEDDFGASFFQGYSDLKRRVALAYSELNSSAFSGVISDYWDAGVSIRA